MRRSYLLLCAVVAGVSAACAEQAEPPVGVGNPMVDSADQVMFDARALLTDRGLLRAELNADTAFFFDESTRIEMVDVHVTFFTQQGARNAVLTARAGTYSTRRGIMEARGNVVVVSEDGRRLTTEQLRYDQARNEISSDSAFVLTERDRRSSGIGFVSDPDMTSVRCLRACSGSVGAVTLPGSSRAADSCSSAAASACSAILRLARRNRPADGVRWSFRTLRPPG